MIAAFSEAVPPTGVYLVKPLLIATMAASLMCCGVSKSGSPAPSPMMSLPSAFSFAARAVTARVGDGLMACTRRESDTIFPLGLMVGADYTRHFRRGESLFGGVMCPVTAMRPTPGFQAQTVPVHLDQNRAVAVGTQQFRPLPDVARNDRWMRMVEAVAVA